MTVLFPLKLDSYMILVSEYLSLHSMLRALEAQTMKVLT